MAYYEMLYILSANLSDEEREALIVKLKETVEKNKGSVVNESKWGLRNLTYSIKKQDKGYYVLSYLELPEQYLKDLKYFLKVNEGFLRAMILKKKRPVQVEKEEEVRGNV